LGKQIAFKFNLQASLKLFRWVYNGWHSV